MIVPRCTMQEVARRAGVHPATVSRALRQAPGVSAAVREEVQRIAREMEYRPNPLVSALIRIRRSPHRRNFHGGIALLTTASAEDVKRFRADHAQLLQGAKARAAHYGYQLEEFNLGGTSMSAQRVTRILSTRGIPGLLLAPFYSVQETLAVDWTQFSIVAVGFSQNLPVTRVAHNHFSAMRSTLAECRRRGARRVGLVLPRRVHQKTETRWVAAYLYDQFECPPAGGALPPLLLDEVDDHAAFTAWLRLARPDVIVGLQHFTPIDRWLRGLHIRVPDDIGLVTLERRDRGPDYSGTFQDLARIGATGIDQLVALIERHERGLPESPSTVLLDGRWDEGTTLRNRRS